MEEDGYSSNGVWNICSDISLDEFGSFILLLVLPSSGIM